MDNILQDAAAGTGTSADAHSSSGLNARSTASNAPGTTHRQQLPAGPQQPTGTQQTFPGYIEEQADKVQHNLYGRKGLKLELKQQHPEWDDQTLNAETDKKFERRPITSGKEKLVASPPRSNYQEVMPGYVAPADTKINPKSQISKGLTPPSTPEPTHRQLSFPEYVHYAAHDIKHNLYGQEEIRKELKQKHPEWSDDKLAKETNKQFKRRPINDRKGKVYGNPPQPGINKNPESPPVYYDDSTPEVKNTGGKATTPLKWYQTRKGKVFICIFVLAILTVTIGLIVYYCAHLKVCGPSNEVASTEAAVVPVESKSRTTTLPTTAMYTVRSCADHTCGENQQCHNTKYGPVCKCIPGVSCPDDDDDNDDNDDNDDIDECKQIVCPEKHTCLNTVGSYDCVPQNESPNKPKQAAKRTAVIVLTLLTALASVIGIALAAYYARKNKNKQPQYR